MYILILEKLTWALHAPKLHMLILEKTYLFISFSFFFCFTCSCFLVCEEVIKLHFLENFVKKETRFLHTITVAQLSKRKKEKTIMQQLSVYLEGFHNKFQGKQKILFLKKKFLEKYYYALECVFFSSLENIIKEALSKSCFVPMVQWDNHLCSRIQLIKRVFDKLKNQVNMIQSRISYINRYKNELVFY